MEFHKPNWEPLVAPEVEAPAVPVVAESEKIAPEDQMEQAQEQAHGQGQEIPPEQPLEQPAEQPLDQPLEQSAPVMVNIEEPASDHTISRAAINTGYNSDSKAHYHSRSTEFHQSAPEYAAQDTDQSSPLLNHHPLPVPNSRPGSGLSSGPERAPGVSQLQQQDASQRQASQANKNSVVIKVGMVGDAQIGKTSLMVKYVEGSWDEDYIQTLGKLRLCSLGSSVLSNRGLV